VQHDYATTLCTSCSKCAMSSAWIKEALTLCSCGMWPQSFAHLCATCRSRLAASGLLSPGSASVGMPCFIAQGYWIERDCWYSLCTIVWLQRGDDDLHWALNHSDAQAARASETLQTDPLCSDCSCQTLAITLLSLPLSLRRVHLTNALVFPLTVRNAWQSMCHSLVS
jgi:hypothetical protein